MASATHTDTISLGIGGPETRPLGLGTWQWGDRRLWQYGHDYGPADVRQAFDVAVQGGVTLFDTAEIYGGGESERLLGTCIRESAARVLVATKFMPFPWRVQRGALPRALEASLGRLRLPRVDLYQVHFPVPVFAVERWAEEMADAVRLGLTGSVGVSNYSASQMRRTRTVLERHGGRLASNQVEYSLIQRAPERNGVLQACREMDVRLIAYSPLGKGLLGGRYTLSNPPPFARRVTAPRGSLARVPGIIAALRDIGEAHGGKTPAQVSLRWLIEKGTLPIPGAKNAAQAAENAGALGWQLTDEEVARLDRVSQF